MKKTYYDRLGYDALKGGVVVVVFGPYTEYCVNWFDLSIDTDSNFYGMIIDEWIRCLQDEDFAARAAEETLRLSV